MGKNGEKWGIYFMGNRENRLGNSPFFPIGSPPLGMGVACSLFGARSKNFAKSFPYRWGIPANQYLKNNYPKRQIELIKNKLLTKTLHTIVKIESANCNITLNLMSEQLFLMSLFFLCTQMIKTNFTELINFHKYF